MRKATASERHRAHHTRKRASRVGLCTWGVLALSPLGCGPSLPRPEAAPLATSDYVAVPFGPRAAVIEVIPTSPSNQAVWVDGSWHWSSGRYVWRFGRWVIPPKGARLARSAVVRRASDGQLFYSPSVWKGASGQTLEDDFSQALGPLARARARIGAPPPLETEGARRVRARGGRAHEALDEDAPVDERGDEDD